MVQLNEFSEDWQAQAACKGKHEVFNATFDICDTKRREKSREQYAIKRKIEDAAKAICKSCVVRADCLDYAIDNEEKFGVWGGMNTEERTEYARQAQSKKRNYR